MIFVIRACYEKLGHMLKTIVPKFRSDLSVRLRDMAEKQVLAKLKQMVGAITPEVTRGAEIKNKL